MSMKLKKVTFAAEIYPPDLGGATAKQCRDTAYDMVQEGNFIHIRTKDKTNGELVEVPMANVASMVRVTPEPTVKR